MGKCLTLTLELAHAVPVLEREDTKKKNCDSGIKWR